MKSKTKVVRQYISSNALNIPVSNDVYAYSILIKVGNEWTSIKMFYCLISAVNFDIEVYYDTFNNCNMSISRLPNCENDK